jgi:hypothetical protein
LKDQEGRKERIDEGRRDEKNERKKGGGNWWCHPRIYLEG